MEGLTEAMCCGLCGRECTCCAGLCETCSDEVMAIVDGPQDRNAANERVKEV